MKINCIVIDDEPLARQGIKEYIGEVDFLNFVGEFESPLKATSLLSTTGVQLIFLDIQMPKITGLDFFKTLKNPPPVIFTTAYPQFALDGFDLNALDYLVKPISLERFLKAAHKAKEFYDLRVRNQNESNKEDYTDHVFIKVDGKLVKILLENILFVEALQNYVAVHTKDKKYVSYLTLQSIAEFLPADIFIKTHKSFIVAINKVDSIDGNNLQIANHLIPVSRSQKEDVMGKLLGKDFIKR
jgi:DNA-binding LytR/AlgR family response regulator